MTGSRSRLGGRLGDAVAVKVLFFDAGKKPLDSTARNPVSGYLIDTADKSYSFANYWSVAVFFWEGASVEESKPVVAPPQRLSVSPSVVTGQMTVRLQPFGTSRPVVEIHDAVGNLVRSLDCTAEADGLATATWNREDDRGRLVPEGVYFCRYAAAGVIAVRKVLVAH